MGRSIPLIVGAKYYAGASRPFYVTQSMVTGYLEGKGFRAVHWHDRDEALPAGLDPAKDPEYSNDWDEWAEAEYSGSGSGVLDPPAAPKWLRVELPAVAPNPVIALPAATPGTTGTQPPSQTTTPTRVAPVAIVPDPVIVRQHRLGVAASVVGGLLVAWFGFGAIVRRRTETQRDEVQP